MCTNVTLKTVFRKFKYYTNLDISLRFAEKPWRVLKKLAVNNLKNLDGRVAQVLLQVLHIAVNELK